VAQGGYAHVSVGMSNATTTAANGPLVPHRGQSWHKPLGVGLEVLRGQGGPMAAQAEDAGAWSGQP